jgi:hypothetical protein
MAVLRFDNEDSNSTQLHGGECWKLATGLRGRSEIPENMNWSNREGLYPK